MVDKVSDPNKQTEVTQFVSSIKIMNERCEACEAVKQNHGHDFI